jgi:hypothetical protein
MNGGEDTLLAESLNADVAQELSERSGPTGHRQRWEEIAEIVEVLFLAVVAMATAWSGFQAAKWDGREAALYQDATRDRFEAEGADAPLHARLPKGFRRLAGLSSIWVGC